MNILLTSLKGGVGKSSIGYNLAVYTDSRYITNDIVSIDDDSIIQIPPNKKRIPAKYCFTSNTVFDFGAMSTQLDSKIAHAVQLADVIVIPTFTDSRSIQATIDTVRFLANSGKPIVLIINNYKDNRKFESTKKLLSQRTGIRAIYGIRTTTFFERVCRDGRKWLKNIHSNKGEYQLRKTQSAHEQIYDIILKIGEGK